MAPDAAALGSGLSAMAGLRDLAEVQGSFFVSPWGELLARDMPALLPDDVLGEVAVRVVRLSETFTTAQTSVSWFVVRYGAFLLFVRQMGKAALCVLSSPGVNMAALRMGANLVARRMTSLGLTFAEADPTTAAVAPAAVAHPHAPPAQITPTPTVTGSWPATRADFDAAPTGIKWRGSVMPKK